MQLQMQKKREQKKKHATGGTSDTRISSYVPLLHYPITTPQRSAMLY
jgi:hypothetical protein